MPLESYPQPHEVAQSQAALKTAAMGEAQVAHIGGATWTITRRERATGAGLPASVVTTQNTLPVWVFKGAWILPGGAEQPTEGYRYVTERGQLKVDDTLQSQLDPSLRFTVVSVERETDYAEGRLRPVP